MIPRIPDPSHHRRELYNLGFCAGIRRAQSSAAKDIAGPVALAKVQGAQVVERAVREAQQILGGRGYERGRTMTEQVSRDLRLKVIGGGSEEILSDLAWREEHKMARAKQDQRQKQGAKL
ncbi:acyl-CoA dehydrogenase [Apiospora rasikravindrae]|uniref:Acyl-CoA dehydrogenase n=1 Tax=Apiospora rasikravindrae TaxID=990691 RepID=A0ABR1SNX7_9PEZI